MKRLGCLLLATSMGLATTPTGEETDSHEATLKAAGLKTDNAALLDFFHKRTLSDAERARLAGLIRQLGADSYGDRVRASEQLIDVGRKAAPFLQAALKDPDPEIALRARRCLRAISVQPETDLILAAARLLAARKPDNALPALLGFLPFLEEDATEEELFRAVEALGFSPGKPAPALLSALTGKYPRQRSAAVWSLGRSPKSEDRDRVLPHLRDEDASVRYRSAEALLWGKDRRGVAVLLGLLEKGPEDVAGMAEGMLTILAGDAAPGSTLGPTAQERRECQMAWEKWWREQGARLDLAKLDFQAVRGLRMVAANSGYGGNGAIWEYGNDHKDRWLIRHVGGPFDFAVLPAGRVLVAEYNDRRVTERDRSGKVLWEYRPPNAPLEVHRLPGGNILVATNYEVLEVTRERQVVFSHKDSGGNIFSAQKLPSGNILYGLYSGMVIEIDRKGAEVHRFGIERPRGLANIVVLPGQRYLVPYAASNRIVEVDRSGKVLREVTVPSPTSVALLPGGNLLVGSHILSNVREIDRKGKVLWEHRAEGQIFRVRVR